MSGRSVWKILGIDATDDVALIRRAYATKLKQDRPEDAQSFQQLRAAYEWAMHYAQHQHTQHVAGAQLKIDNDYASIEDDDGSDEAAAIPSDKLNPVTPDTSDDHSTQPRDERAEQLNELRNAFQNLHQALWENNSDASKQWLAVILRSKAAEHVDVEQRVEYELAELLASKTPASDGLLETVINRFGWKNQHVNRVVSQTISAIIGRFQEMAFLEALKSGKHEFSAEYNAMKTAQPDWKRWLSAARSKLNSSGEHKLLQIIRTEHPSLLREFDPTVVAWYDRFYTTPQPSVMLIFVLSIFSFAIVPVATALIWSNDMSAMHLLASLVFYIFAGTIIVFVKLYAFEWPRYYLNQKAEPGLRLFARLGWAPVMIFSLLLTAFNYSSTSLVRLMSVISVLSGLWIMIVKETGRPFVTQRQNTRPSVLMIVFNLPVIAWWLVAATHFPESSAEAIALPCIVMIIASTETVDMICTILVDELSSRVRKRCIEICIGISLATGSSMVAMHSNESLRPLAFALVVSLITLQRPFGFLLSKRQLQIRIGVFMLGYMILFKTFGAFAGSPLALDIGAGIVFCTTSMATLIMAWWNEHRGDTAWAHLS